MINNIIHETLLSGVFVKFIIQRESFFHTILYGSLNFLFVKNNFIAVGTTVIAVKSDSKIAEVIVIARSEKSCPTSSPRNTTGKKIATVVAVDVTSAPQTCSVP